MPLTFAALQPEYVSLLAAMHVVKPGLDHVVDRLLGLKARYLDVAQQTGVPAAWLLAVDYRESDNNALTCFANGDPLSRATTHVPAGLGPFLGPDAWQRGCVASLRHDHIDQVHQPWTMPLACYEAEAWNGFGPRQHGKRTGYLWAGTDAYAGGGYPRDGHWDSNWHDNRFGAVPIIVELGRRDLALAIGATESSPSISAHSPPPPDSHTQTSALQQALDDLGFGPIAVDGSFGRQTRQALKAFQHANHLAPDGILGPLTTLALRGATGNTNWPDASVP